MTKFNPAARADLDIAAIHLALAITNIESAIRNGVGDKLGDGHMWKLVLNTVRAARRFVGDSADELRAEEPK